MGVTSFSDEHTSPVAPSRIFRASIVDSHNLIPKLLPQVIKSMDIIEGDGGAGSIKQITFTEGKITSSFQWDQHFDSNLILIEKKKCELYH